MDSWIQPFGYPKVLRCDRGLHNRGVLQNELAAAGAQISNCGLEAPYQIGKVERAGELWKSMCWKVIIARHVSGFEDITIGFRGECHVNDMAKVSGFSQEPVGFRSTTATRTWRPI